MSQPTDWKVLYGELRQFAAYFDDHGRAEKFARDHRSDTIIALAEVRADGADPRLTGCSSHPATRQGGATG